MKTTSTRLFYVTYEKDANEEIFETLEKCEKYLSDNKIKARVWICEVKNAYKEKGFWNYEDLSDTFTRIKRVH